MGGSRWIWRNAYSLRQTPESLVYSDGKITLLYRFFQRLWAEARQGMQIHQLVYKDLKVGAVPPSGIGGVAFVRRGESTVLLYNRSPQTYLVNLEDNNLGRGEVWRFGIQGESKEHISLPVALPADCVLVLHNDAANEIDSTE
jgi:hypothetical protein